MKVLKINNTLIRQLDEIDNLLEKIVGKSKKKDIARKVDFIHKSIFDIKVLHKESSPIEMSALSDLLLEMNDVLRILIIHKLSFREYTVSLNRFSKMIVKSMESAYYDFFRLCGKCATCCTSPYVFSFEHDFIDKYRKYLERKGMSYVIKNDKKTGLCSLYDSKNKKCTVYHDRPLDCTFFPFSFVINTVKESESVKSRDYIILSKATECDIANRLSLNDALEALEMICFVLSKIPMEEAKQYSRQVDPRKMTCDISVPYEERKVYYKALKQICDTKLYMRKG